MSSPEPPTDASGPGASDGAFRPLIFGETLFDHFPDGSRVLGGAPFNVAWHLSGFKADPLLISSVGQDPEGREILEKMVGWGMNAGGVQLHPARPTGQVTALFEGGEPIYRIEPGQAYDDVTREGLPPDEELRRSHLLYHGSLALREAGSLATCRHLRHTPGLPTLVDVNLRAPWWNRRDILGLMEGADWVKVNREEATLLAGIEVGQAEEAIEPVAALRESLGIGSLVVTMGAEGALALTPDGPLWQGAPTVTDGIDSVGAGDAFSAILALGARGGWPVGVTLARAVDFAADLCRIRGATTDDRDLYSRHLRRWADAD